MVVVVTLVSMVVVVILVSNGSSGNTGKHGGSGIMNKYSCFCSSGYANDRTLNAGGACRIFSQRIRGRTIRT